MIDAASASNSNSDVRAMRRELLLGEEVRVARRDDAFDREQARVSVVGMQAVRLATDRARARRRAASAG